MLLRARLLARLLVPSAASLVAVAAACSTHSGQPPEVTPPPVASAVTSSKTAEIVAVPLTAPSAQTMAYQQESDLTPPWSLTASDGTGLALARVDARAVFEGPLAYTELHLYFHNPESRRREGTFQITLPPNAAVSRFAMETDGQMVEAEVVDKMTARRAYDDFLHRRQDPALLEKGAGNQFSAKVFPIAGGADKHIVISFSQQLAGTPYVLPLRGLPQTERVDVTLSVLGSDGSRTEQALHEHGWKPDRDFVSTTPASAAAVGAGELIAAQVGVDTQAAAAAAKPPAAVTLLIDTSASRAAGFRHYIHTVRDLVAAMAKRYGDALPVDVVAFDQDTQSIYSGPASGYGDAADRALVERGAAGASDLERALAAVPAATAATPMRRVVVVTDGVMTAGAGGAELAKLAAKLDHVDRIDVALAGGIRDEAVATALVRAQLPHAGAVLDLDADGADATAVALAEPVLLDVAVDVPGAAWVYPRVLPTVRAGHRQMVYARMAKPAQSVAVVVGGVSHEMGIAAVAPALIERAVAGAEIDELEARLDGATGDAAAQLKSEISRRSIAARVVSSQTAMLVLENDYDYARYHIDRNALADILVVGPHGVEQTRRVAMIAAKQPEPKPASSQTVAMDPEHATQKDALKVRTEEVTRSASATAPAMARAQVAPDDVALALDEGKMGKQDSNGIAYEKAGGEGGVVGGDIAADDTGGAPGAAQGMATMPPPPPAPRPTTSVAQPMSVAPVMAPTPPMAPGHRVERGTSEDSGAPRYASGPSGGVTTRIATDQVADADESEAPDGGAWPPSYKPAALTGTLGDVEAALARHDVDGALRQARAWHDKEPGDVLALIALGDALEAKHATATAARIYGSIIDLFPARADLRRFAGERLERLGAAPHWLAVDTYQRAVADRPDHLTGHRLLAYALLRDGKPAEAFAAILAGIDQPYPEGRYAGGDRVLAEDAGMIGAAYLKAEPGKRADIEAQLAKRGAALATSASTRFILYWETDGNDVDFHIQDAKRNHAFYGHKHLASGGDLYADITTGYGPECFAIQGVPQAGPYRLSIDYFSQGPMGYGMGLLEVQRYDGHGGLSFEDRPYVIMADHAYVDLGTFK